jgi:predicted nucleic acid-binding protein
MTDVFVDTVALLALWEINDQWHEAAERTFLQANQENWRLLTTSFVLLETGNAVARKPHRRALLNLRAGLLLAGNLIEPNEDDCRIAWEAYERHDAGKAGIVDLVSFQVMRRLGLTDAITSDEHFRAAGFHTLMT